MKKVLIIHNLYRNFGGEDSAINGEVELLSKKYHVDKILFDNKNRLNFFDFLNFVFISNIQSNRLLKDKINNFKPDYIYIHNLWFKGSLGLLKVIKNYDIPLVLKIHNFRYICANSFFCKAHLGKNKFCPACGMKKTFIFNKYFKDSYNELRNFVSWPSFNEGINLTILVAIFSIIYFLGFFCLH